MFVEARKLDVDYNTLGASMLARKQELKASGVPTFVEQTLIAQNGIADSPAETAKAMA